MIKLDTYSASGIKSATKTNLPSEFGETKNIKLLAQAIRVYQNRLHPGTSKTKTRGELRISTRKIYRQKGTGLARHGAKSAPIFVGGSKAHGPKGLKRTLTLPKNMKRRALGAAMIEKTGVGHVIVVNDISKIEKTKQASNLITKIIKSKEIKRQPKVTLVLSVSSKSVVRVFRNIKNVEILFEDSLNALSIYYGGLILIDKNVFIKDKNNSLKKNIKNKK